MIKITTQEFEQFKDFINKLLYETMTLDDYEIIMNRLNVPKPIKHNNTWMYKSICHNENPHDCKNNLAFYTENRSYYCFSQCQVSYNLITLLEKRFDLLGEAKTRFQCVKWICEQLNIPFNFKSDLEKPKTHIYHWEENLSKYLKSNKNKISLKVYDKDILNCFEECYHQSWIDDGISIDTMEKYGIKYYHRNDSIIIPCFDIDGNLIGIRQRFLNPNSNCKYLPLELLNGTSFEFPVATILYGLNYNAQNISYYKKVVLGESEKFVQQSDSMFCYKNFALGMYGKSMSKQKAMEILKLGVEEVIICLDADYEEVCDENGNFTKEFESFKKNVYRIGDYFKGHCKVTSTIIYDKHPKNCSPTDLGKEKYLELFKNRENLY